MLMPMVMLHLSTALLALGLGAFNLARPKGTRARRS
jgi:uncharacterized membrane protein